MNIIRWVLLAALALAFLMFAVANWTPVPFRLPDGTVISVMLPLLLAAAFVLGWLPTHAYHRIVRANRQRREAKSFGSEPVAALPPLSHPDGAPTGIAG